VSRKSRASTQRIAGFCHTIPREFPSSIFASLRGGYRTPASTPGSTIIVPSTPKSTPSTPARSPAHPGPSLSMRRPASPRWLALRMARIPCYISREHPSLPTGSRVGSRANATGIAAEAAAVWPGSGEAGATADMRPSPMLHSAAVAAAIALRQMRQPHEATANTQMRQPPRQQP
jgi:hypothetical protein